MGKRSIVNSAGELLRNDLEGDFIYAGGKLCNDNIRYHWKKRWYWFNVNDKNLKIIHLILDFERVPF